MTINYSDGIICVQFKFNLFVDEIKLVNRDGAIAKFSQVERKVMKILNLALVLGTSDNKVLV
ncbi:hypothetical protein QUA58_19060 [Microcoleus sp. N9_A1]